MATITYEKLSQKLSLHQVTIPQIQEALEHEKDKLHDITFFLPRMVDARYQEVENNILALQNVLADVGASSIYAQQCSNCGEWIDDNDIEEKVVGLLCPVCFTILYFLY